MIGSLILLCALSSPPHIPPPVHFRLRVENGAASLDVLLWAEIYEGWVDAPSDEDAEMAPEAWRALRGETVQKELSDLLGVQVDGLEVTPRLTGLEFQEGLEINDFIPYVVLRTDLGAKGDPRAIELRVRSFAIAIRRMTRNIALNWDEGPESEIRRVLLEEDEPAFTWHAPARIVKPRVNWVPPAPPRLHLPLLSLAVIAMAFGSLWIRPELGYGWIKLIAGAGLAILLVPVGNHAMAHPWKTPAGVPDDQAIAIFETLHTNIYRAFDQDAAEAVYDTLARSVDEGLLETVYERVYEQLILRDEGGAVSRVRSVRHLETAVETPAEQRGTGFVLRTRWRVQGRVSHDGHQHTRTLTCEARYALAPGASGWRIRSEEILSTTREQEDIADFTGR